LIVPPVIINVEISSANRHQNQATKGTTAVMFIVRSNSFKWTKVPLNFQLNVCLHITKFTPTGM